MIKKKPSDVRCICCSHDPAILPAGEKKISEYILGRDLEKLGVSVETGKFEETQELVSLFYVKPLSNDYFHLIEGGVSALKEIFRTHVVAVKNVEGVKINFDNNKSYINDESMENVDQETLAEVASVIVELGQGRDGVERAFFSGGSSLSQRIRSRHLFANRVRIGNVNNTQKDTDSENENTENVS